MVPRLAPISLLFLAVYAGACARPADESLTGVSEAASSHDDLGPLSFRDIFASYLRDAGRSESEIKKLVYLATSEVIDPRATPQPTPEESLAEIDAKLASIRPSDLYERGDRTPLAPARDVDRSIAARGGVTIVVVPDLMDELAAGSPFQEVIDRTDSAAALEWRDALAAATVADATDPSYSLTSLGAASASLGDLVKVASIDHTDGKPLVRVIVLQTGSHSLESVGTIDDGAAIVLRRLDKVFRVLGASSPTRFYALGHGRGASLALEVASRVRTASTSASWGSTFAGVMSLGGTLYGSPLADAALVRATPTGKIFRRFGDVSRDLETCTDGEPDADRQRKIAANVSVWNEAMSDLDGFVDSLPANDELGWEGFSSTIAESGRFGRRVHRALADGALHLGSASAGTHCQDVARFKKLFSAVSAGITADSTAARHAWWKSHTIPGDMKLFALTSVMGDVSTARTAVWPLTTNTVAYDPGTIDMKSARADFYDVYDATGLSLNDGLIPVSRARFWPALMTQANAAQPAIRSYFLGTLGTHHTGLVHAEAIETVGVGANPFPRALLLKAIARFSVEAQAREP